MSLGRVTLKGLWINQNIMASCFAPVSFCFTEWRGWSIMFLPTQKFYDFHYPAILVCKFDASGDPVLNKIKCQPYAMSLLSTHLF